MAKKDAIKTPPSETLTIVENILRDFIEEVFTPIHGAKWIDHTGIKPERIKEWEKRRDEERKRRDGGKAEERILYYSEITDLKGILEKNWGLFASCFGERRDMEVNMNRLIDFRNPNRHGRDLLPFEKSLLDGIAGEIRNKITIYKSKKGPNKEHFPRIEYVRDSFGNTAGGGVHQADTNLVVHPGQTITFQLKAWDPEGEPVHWRVLIDGRGQITDQVEDADIEWKITDAHIGDPTNLIFVLSGNRHFHKMGSGYDDSASFLYRVLPED